MGAFDDTICQLRDLGMSKVANIIRDLERDNMTLAGNNFKLRDEITALRAAIENQEKVEPVAWMLIDETGMKWVEVLRINQAYNIPLYPHPAPAVPEEMNPK